MPKIPLDPFRACVFAAAQTPEWVYRSLVAFAGIYISLMLSEISRDLTHPYRLGHLRLHRRLCLEAQG